MNVRIIYHHQKDPSPPLVQQVQKTAQSDMHVPELSAESFHGSSGLPETKTFRATPRG
jgi:hypothetical protein